MLLKVLFILFSAYVVAQGAPNDLWKNSLEHTKQGLAEIPKRGLNNIVMSWGSAVKEVLNENIDLIKEDLATDGYPLGKRIENFLMDLLTIMTTPIRVGLKTLGNVG